MHLENIAGIKFASLLLFILSIDSDERVNAEFIHI